MKLSNFSKMSFGIGALGKDLCYAVISYFLMIYFTDTVGLTPLLITFINSTDNSVTYNITENDIALMETLKTLAKELENSNVIIDSIEEMKNNVGKKSFAEKYNSFIQSVANHMTIFAPFIPALTQLLTK